MTIKLAAVTGTYMGILGGYYLYLTINVIKERRNAQIAIGDGSSAIIQQLIESGKNANVSDYSSIDPSRYQSLVIAIRAHGNFNEFIPLVGVLSLINELHGAPAGLLHLVLGSFTAARIAHVHGLKAKQNIGLGRKVGAASTILTLSLASLGSFYFSNKELIHSLIGR
ncbi:hypothetical protein RB653_003423 [Dictyostelium firmibasis]|uniref:Uncharacterized protein n=1 Tax=Dictyostelium firmibasis TaxID=79012 RepID=A0AAN7U4M0_9MYCE